MSSCFLCDTSYKMTDDDNYNVVYAEGQTESCFMKYMPIMIGSSGMTKDDQQHNDNNKQNYVSYRVKKIEFRCSVSDSVVAIKSHNIPSYIILFKVPFREPIFDYYFTILKNFILFSEPESVLKYYVCPDNERKYPVRHQRFPNKYDLIVNKPFIVGPNDYVGVLYFFCYGCSIDASAKVWFDVV